jgi:formate/nitrite transporter FocA (FNT family)
VIKKSILASILIALGNMALLSMGTPIGPFLFSLGLISVCMLNANLFTGKCGYLVTKEITIQELAEILGLNLLSGWVIGRIIGIGNPNLIPVAAEKINTWSISIPYFMQSFFCGVIMFIAVELYRRGTCLGILIGVPAFIFCGFQHCIANIITLGIANDFSLAIVICILGNFIGSIFIAYLIKEE